MGFSSGGGTAEVTQDYRAGTYMLSAPNGTGGTPANNQMRLHPMTMQKTITIVRLGVIVAVAGEAGCKFRPVVYADASGLPDALVVDAGQLAADAVASVEAVVAAILQAGQTYFWGGMTQLAPVTPPQLSCVNNPFLQTGDTALPSAAGVGFIMNGAQAGAAPAQSPGISGIATGNCPRLIYKVA